MPPSDEDLLSRYAAENSDDAFAVLVARHLNLVYSVAHRVVRSPHLAEDIAQAVFIDLARNARTIKTGTPLVAWLHLVSRRTAIDTVRRESRRQAREATAAILSDTADMKPPASPWTAVEPLLDEAVESLDATDRTAILLRYFENKSLREVGAALGTSDDTAQKRVSRAVDQLRTFFLRRGVPVTAGALAADLSAHAIFTAPVALGGFISTATLATTATAIAPVVVMSLALKTLVATAAAALIAVLVYNATSRPTPPPGVTAAVAASSVAALPAPGAPARPAAAVARVTPGSPEDLRVALLRRLFVDLPAQSLPELRLLESSDWLEIAHAHELDSAADIRVALAKLRSMARKKFATHVQTALRRFTDGSGGVLPADILQLAPHLDAPADAEMLARYATKRTGRLGEADEELIAEKPTSDVILTVGLDSWHMRNNSDHAQASGETETDTLERAAKSIGNALGPDGEKLMAGVAGEVTAWMAMTQEAMQQISTAYGGEEAFGAELKDAVRQFTAAHPGEPVTDLGQILPFLPSAEKFTALTRTSFAPMAYLAAHPGQPPPDAEQLRRYLASSPDLAAAFKAMKLAWDGEHLTMSFNFKWDDKKD